MMAARKQGFQRVKIDGEVRDLNDVLPQLDKNKKHNIEIIIDRIVVDESLGNRLADSIETALKLSDGLLMIEIVSLPENVKNLKKGEIITLSEKFSCPVSGFTIPEIEPRLFSFNSPHGACPACDGLGQRVYFDENLVVPDDSLSIAEGAVVPWSKGFAPFYMQDLEAVAKHFKFKTNIPWRDLKKEHRDIILYGSGKEPVAIAYNSKSDNTCKSNKPFKNVIPSLAP